MYGPAGKYYDRLYSGKDYHQESLAIIETIKSYCPAAHSLLDVGCGTGGHLQHLSNQYDAEGMDLSKDLVKIARQRLPDIRIHQASMISFKLDRAYDVVLCLFSSIGYVRTTSNLNRAVKCMANHLTPGGILLIEPWFAEQSWQPKPVYATFVDDPDTKIARISTNKKQGKQSIIEMHYLVGTAAGVKYYKELHRMGLFAQKEMIDAYGKAGLHCEYKEEGITGRGLYIGTSSS
jgi:SAM-dependent methyltransferase